MANEKTLQALIDIRDKAERRADWLRDMSDAWLLEVVAEIADAAISAMLAEERHMRDGADITPPHNPTSPQG